MTDFKKYAEDAIGVWLTKHLTIKPLHDSWWSGYMWGTVSGVFAAAAMDAVLAGDWVVAAIDFAICATTGIWGDVRHEARRARLRIAAIELPPRDQS